MKKLGAVVIGLAVLFMSSFAWAEDSGGGLVPRLSELNLKAAGADIKISFSYENVAGGMRHASLYAIIMVEGMPKYAKIVVNCKKAIGFIAVIAEDSDITQGKFMLNLPIAREIGLKDGDKLTIHVAIADLLGNISEETKSRTVYTYQWEM